MHPFERLASPGRWFAGAVLATLAMTLVMTVVGKPLQRPAAPMGIISFELARDPAVALRILGSWSGPDQARLSLRLDFLYILLYANCLALGCVWSMSLGAAGFARTLAWAVWIAGLLDCIENLALLRVLAEGPDAAVVSTAFWCATLKFALVAVGVFWILLALAQRAFTRA